MGLDIFLLRKKKEEEYTEEEKAEQRNAPFMKDELYCPPCEEIGYWRKVPELASLIEEMLEKYRPELKGEFNCQDLILTKEIALEMIQRIKEDDLNFEAMGFFWGEALTPGEERFEENKKRTLGIFETALEKIEEGYEIFCFNSW